MEEIWKDVVCYENLFKVSNFGRVFSKRTNKILKQSTSKKGYKVFSTRIGGRKGLCICFKVHRLVAQAFIDNPENKPQVNHIDGNKLNNNVTNLEWVTSKENIQHAVENNLCNFEHMVGTKCRFSKLTELEVLEIRKAKSLGVPTVDLCLKYGVVRQTINQIYRGKYWKDVI